MSDDTQVVRYYEPGAGGRILSTMTISRAMAFYLVTMKGKVLVEGTVDVGLDWLSEGVVTPRPENTSVLNGQTITGIPLGSFVSVLDIREQCNDGEVELAFEDPGSYQVSIESWPHLPARFEIEIKNTDAI